MASFSASKASGLSMFDSIPKDQFKEMLEQAVYQQLFLGSDKIMGRIPKDTMSFKDVGRILSIFIEFLKEQIKTLTPDKLEKFLHNFEAKFMLDLADVKERISQNLAGMGNLSGQEIILLYMVLTKLLETMREEAYKEYGLSQINKSYMNQTGGILNVELERKLHDLASKGEENISLIYNLCFIRLLSESFDEKLMISNSKRQITRKINQLMQKI